MDIFKQYYATRFKYFAVYIIMYLPKAFYILKGFFRNMVWEQNF